MIKESIDGRDERIERIWEAQHKESMGFSQSHYSSNEFDAMDFSAFDQMSSHDLFPAPEILKMFLSKRQRDMLYGLVVLGLVILCGGLLVTKFNNLNS